MAINCTRCGRKLSDSDDGLKTKEHLQMDAISDIMSCVVRRHQTNPKELVVEVGPLVKIMRPFFEDVTLAKAWARVEKARIDEETICSVECEACLQKDATILKLQSDLVATTERLKYLEDFLRATI